ncbi:hypothetical protein CFN78_20115 [Amycolatopsis antarctica]|uniref:DUF397 domain-containing protein n=1 Tax=Amycolatopsis antarctica TaxID=1854586 RepID=A0A263D279_9PSEU|nr:hypothetical protein [Amycolatopsis antarctica]OZM71455.1 hypothetical protein CFN78_20115 [Amycolatopsis antarctica]
MDAWARIEGDCPVRCQVVGGEAEFEIGDRAASLSIVATRSGLAALASASQRALDEMERAES